LTQGAIAQESLEVVNGFPYFKDAKTESVVFKLNLILDYYKQGNTNLTVNFY